jgi:type IV pilus assembly protein PilA
MRIANSKAGSSEHTARPGIPIHPFFSGEQRMLKARKGFTLIELLIVIVIIGILAAIAIPKFGKTREKAYFKAMMSDLRNLQSQQELYYSRQDSGYSYAATIDAANFPDFNWSAGVTGAIGVANNTGWSATATHQALTQASQYCGIIVGGAAPAGPALTPGVIGCTGDQ